MRITGVLLLVSFSSISHLHSYKPRIAFEDSISVMVVLRGANKSHIGDVTVKGSKVGCRLQILSCFHFDMLSNELVIKLCLLHTMCCAVCYTMIQPLDEAHSNRFYVPLNVWCSTASIQMLHKRNS